MKTWKKIALVTGLALSGTTLLAYSKFERIKRIFDRMSYFPKISNFKINLKNINFDLKVELTNHTGEDLNLSSAGLVKLTKFIIYDLQGRVLAVLKVNDLYKISVPAYGKAETPSIYVEMPLTNIISIIPSEFNLNNFSVDQMSKILKYGFEVKTFYGSTYNFSTK